MPFFQSVFFVKLTRTFSWLVGIGTAAVVASLFLNVQYALPVGDDIGFSSAVSEVGWWQFIVDRYRGWNGRYSADAMFGIVYSAMLWAGNGSIFDAYWVGSLITIVSAVVGIHLLLVQMRGGARHLGTDSYRSLSALSNKLPTVLQRVAHTTRHWHLSYVVFFCWLMLVRSAQTIYPVNGGASYVIGGAVSCLLWSVLIAQSRAITRKQPQYISILMVIGCGLLSFFATGFNESIMLMLCVGLITGTIWASTQCRKAMPLWVSALLGNIIGICVVSFAPGNFVRIDALAQVGLAPSVDKTLLDSIGYFIRHQLLFLVYGGGIAWVCTLIIYGLLRCIQPSKSILQDAERNVSGFINGLTARVKLLMIGAVMCIPFAGMLAIVTITGGIGPHRVIDGIYFLTVPLCILLFPLIRSLVVWHSISTHRYTTSLQRHPHLIEFVAMLILCLCALNLNDISPVSRLPYRWSKHIQRHLPSTPAKLVVDATGRGRQYYQAHRDVISAIELMRQQGITDVTVATCYVVAPSLASESLIANPQRNYLLNGYVRYFDINSLTIKPNEC